MAELTKAIAARIAELQTLDWREIQKAGKPFGLDKKLPDIDDWEGMAQPIAIAEAEAAKQPVYKAGNLAEVDSPPPLTAEQNQYLQALSRSNMPYCTICAQPHRGTANGQPACPIRYKQCPRLVGNRS